MITLRPEQPQDYEKVFHLIEEAFRNSAESNHQEQFLVERLRKSPDFIPELSIVAEFTDDDTGRVELAGHILFTKVTVENGLQTFSSLTLAPVSVKPAYQGRGIGGHLIAFGHMIAEEMGYESVVLAGHADYYLKFGYRNAADFGITFPFDVPGENAMATELKKNALKYKKGRVKYPVEFEL
ncbi:N-acetyltransferase [Chryseobacterium sp. SN22]|uniref:GNAT family N-acetyltransferase n=1 Tax=Chryseobacterium sp. SN22 TaxID=2606431 RepID=UPI0011EDC457|nr:N-acetyltransferase [Chryseobacterium sp. SN22]KAA0127056.1 N-acetyltransferase [Chryseobacterium sp. SN22]